MTQHTINAEGKSIGVVSSEAAQVLQGKTSASYEKHKVAAIKVVIDNAGKLFIGDRKRSQKEYVHYTGYSSGRIVESMTQVVAKKGQKELLRQAISRMLPRNKLRTLRMKNLTIHE
jgi:large subunit ribosomal protein L13